MLINKECASRCTGWTDDARLESSLLIAHIVAEGRTTLPSYEADSYGKNAISCDRSPHHILQFGFRMYPSVINIRKVTLVLFFGCVVTCG
jgi:hypothetical protein